MTTEDELAALRAENERLKAELSLWKPLSPDEAERALDEAEAVPMSDDAIAEIVKRATDPAEIVTNNEQAQLAIRVRTLEADLAALRLLAGELARALESAPKENERRPVRCEASAAESVPSTCECYACALMRHHHAKVAALAAYRAATEDKR